MQSRRYNSIWKLVYLELDECIEYLKIVKEQNKMKRDFSKFI
jgi:hypothetical protein